MLAAIFVYVVFSAGLYLGAQPFGLDLIETIATPLKLAKRAILGREPLLVSYEPVDAATAIFAARRAPDIDAIVLKTPDLASVLPANMGPAPDASSLDDLLRDTKRGRAPTRILASSKRDLGGGVHRFTFEYGWNEAHFLANEPSLSECVFLVVPGTGIDEAAKIVARTGYHEDLIDNIPCQSLVYVKPNHGSRQILYGGLRAEFDYVYATMIANGGSYSYWYLSELIDTAIYLKAQGRRVGIVGLSQGGLAALLVGAVADVDLTMSLSGYFNPSRGMISNQHQILIDGMLPFIAPYRLAGELSDKRLIISYGKKDLPVFRHEAETQDSCKVFSESVAGFTCIIHDRGHTHPLNLKTVAEAMLDAVGSQTAE